MKRILGIVLSLVLLVLAACVYDPTQYYGDSQSGSGTGNYGAFPTPPASGVLDCLDYSNPAFAYSEWCEPPNGIRLPTATAIWMYPPGYTPEP